MPANTDERKAAETLLEKISGFSLFANKGFLGEDWQIVIHQRTNNESGTQTQEPVQTNGPKHLSVGSKDYDFESKDCSMKSKMSVKNLDRLLVKTTIGLCTRIVAKMTDHLIKYILRYKFGINALTFSKVQT